MKSFITCIVLVSFLFITAYSQNDSTQESKSKPKSKMRTTGIILLSSGVATLVGGISLGVQTGGFSYEYNNTNGHVTESGEPINGVAGLITTVGSISTVCGIVFTIIGQKSIKRQKQMSFNVVPNGINLCYKF